MDRVIRSRLAAVGLALAGLLLAAPAAHAFDQNGVIFVHGFSGSGAQFESQKMRLTGNGYPESWVRVLEYDSLFATESREQIYARLDNLIAEVKGHTRRPKIDVLGHSLGTSLMQEYLNSSPGRAANVAHYVNIDGRTGEAPPGGVPTLALWAGRGESGRQIKGASNVTLPNQTHVEASTSAEAFEAFYEFFTGKRPRTSVIVPQDGPITVAGRAMLFPVNRGLTATSVEVWRIDPRTGQRVGSRPAATAAIGANGAFGPARIQPGLHYEFAVRRPGVATLHYYYEPFLRSDHLLRLLYNDAIEAVVQRSERHVAGLVLRYKELWGDQGAQSDVLRFNGTSACNAATCPIDHRVNAVFAYDRQLDGQTDTSSPDPIFFELPFITGVDVFMPAARPAEGTTTLSLRSRGRGPTRSLRMPNFPSTLDGFVAQFNDFEDPVGGDVAACLNSRGGARGKRLGPARLGRTRSRQRRLLLGKRLRSRRGLDRYCATGGGSFRIGYPTRRLSRRQRALARRRAILILTSSRRFSVRGVRRGSRVSRLRRRLRRERRFRVGRNTWYLARGSAATLVYRARGRRVLDVGVADRRLTRSRRDARRFIRSWELPRR